MTTTREKLKAMIDVAKKATPGPWTCDEQLGVIEQASPEECCEDQCECAVVARVNYVGTCNSQIQEDYDTNHIAAANPTAVIALAESCLEMLTLLEENDSYLEHGHGTSIPCFSVGHNQIKDAIAKVTAKLEAL